MILATHGFLASSIGQIPQVSDADAQAFVNRVYTAGGTLSTNELSAVNTLVIDLKSYSIWTLIKAIYPMVGASAAACAQNLRSSSFTGVFNGGWTFSNTGATPNGTNAYMNTNLNMVNDLSQNDVHISFYSRTDAIGLFAAMGGGTGNNNAIQMYPHTAFGGAFVNLFTNGLISAITPSLNSLGMRILTRSNSTNINYFTNTTKVTQVKASLVGTSLNMFIGAENSSTEGARRFSPFQCAMATFGNGLTDTDVTNYYNAVQAFQTTLSRQV
jgi:hypothetical protein